MNDAELHEVVQALARLVAQPFTGAWQPARDRVVVGVGDLYLLLVPRGPHARLHSLARRPRNPPKPFSFQGALRAHLGGPLRHLHKTPGDRVVDLAFARGRLHLRLTGRLAGLWLLEEDKVLAAYDGPAPAELPPLPPPRGLPSHPRFAPQGDEDWDLAARRHFGELERAERDARRRQALRKGLEQELSRARRLAEALEDDLQRAEEAPRLRRMADALAARLHEVPKGAGSMVVEDLEEPGLVHRITLDPERPAAVTLERLYGRARRLDRGADRVLAHMDEVAARIERLQAALVVLHDAEDLAPLEALVPRRVQRAQAQGPSHPWITWTGPRGERVLVGRHARGNRRLTFQVARGHDLWMHLRDRPGAHLVVPLQPGQSPPLELLLAAAAIALLHGKVPEGASADVQYTQARHVRAIPGESGGRVLVHGEKVLRVTREGGAPPGWTREEG